MGSHGTVTTNQERCHYMLQGRRGGARGGQPAGETEIAVIEAIAALHLEPKVTDVLRVQAGIR